jgi:protein-S-isoprenylcysteine O-methyltransferase Ste14
MQALDDDPIKQELIGQMTRWAVAAAIACVALMGVFALVAALLLAFDIPGWLQIVGGTLLAVGTAAFAWLVASALESSRRHSRENQRPRRLHPARTD